MNKEKLMQFLSDAIDNGAQIEVGFYGYSRTKTEASDLAIKFSEATSEPVKEVSSGTSKWLGVGDVNSKLRSSIFYHESYMETDVDLSGDENVAI